MSITTDEHESTKAVDPRFRNLISADNHVSEPLTLWDSLPPHLRSEAPHLEVRDGRTCVVVEGRVLTRLPVPKELMSDVRWKEGEEIPSGELLKKIAESEELSQLVSPEASDPDGRLRDLDRDGVYAEVMFPNQLIFTLFRLTNPELQIALCRLYNDWLNDGYSSSPRFIKIAALPMLDIDESIKEMRRCSQRGFRGVLLPVHPDYLGHRYNHPDYEPLWTAAEELGMPVHFHSGTGREQRPARNPGGAVINYVITVGGADETVCFLTGSGVLARHPDLKVVMVECGAGWLGWVLTAMDDAYREHHLMVEPKLELLPSEYFRRQGYVTFQNDPVGLNNLQFTGDQSLMWGCDYPHLEGTWPHSLRYLEAQMTNVPDESVQRILWGNAAALYGVEVPEIGGRRG
jgi:predicted TIM-barrel fold metal-dependent hydrolase